MSWVIIKHRRITEFGSGNAEVGNGNAEVGRRNAEWGRRKEEEAESLRLKVKKSSKLKT
jgi:hypothetical protein